MTTLCIDTATDHGTIVVARDSQIKAIVRWHAAGKHAENIFGFIETALEDAQVTRDDLALVGVDVGPGRFTSVRVGLATAKGLALGLGLPIVGVDALRVLARSIEGDSALARISVMNAYRGDVFCGAYLLSGGGWTELVEPSFGAPEHVFERIRAAIGDREVAVRGGGVAENAALIRKTFGITLDDQALRSDAVSADGLLDEVRHVSETEGPADLALLAPKYLRPSDAKLPDRALDTGHSL
jgi:tRNA threonylcarbamoyladenosine biosynthesis protein TsaB